MAEQLFQSNIEFDCPKCKREVLTSAEVPEPDWRVDDMSDLSSESTTEIHCPSCKTVFVAHVSNANGSCDVSLVDYPDVRVQAGDAFLSTDDDWSQYAPPNDPYTVFQVAFDDLMVLLGRYGRPEGTSIFNRMVFAQQVSALEAYLSDTGINRARADPDAGRRLASSVRQLGETKYSLAEFSADRNLLSKAVEGHLRSVVYHNLPKVRALYKAVFDMDLFTILADNKGRLLQAIELRHDCVHRNGRDKDGNAHEIFTTVYVGEIGTLIHEFADGIEKKIPRLADDDQIPL